MNPNNQMFLERYLRESTQQFDAKHPNLIQNVSDIKTIRGSFDAGSQKFTLHINDVEQKPDLELEEYLTFIFIIAKYDLRQPPTTIELLGEILKIARMENLQIKPLKPNPLILALAIIEKTAVLDHLVLHITKSYLGFDYLKDAVEQIKDTDYFDSFIIFCLEPKIDQQSTLTSAYHANREGLAALSNFINSCLPSQHSEEAKLSALAILRIIFIDFINQGKDAVFGDMVKILMNKIKSADNQDQKSILIKILIGFLTD